MGLFSRYSKNGSIRVMNLENRTSSSLSDERKSTMARNSKKIRREVIVDGQKRWITADDEQDYADKLMTLASPKKNGEKHNFRDYADHWFYRFAKPNIAAVTAINYRRQLDIHIYPVIGDKNIEDLDVFSVQQIFNRLGSDMKQETKHKVRIVLNQIFKMAVEDEIIHKNPMNSPTLKIKGLPSVATEPYSVDEMRYFVSHLRDLENDLDRGWLAISSCLPLRPEEVLGLRWADIDENALTVHVRNTVTHPDRNQPVFHVYTKTASSNRVLSIPQSLVELLPDRGNDRDYVFGGVHPLSYSQLRTMCRRIARTIKYEGTITPRRFRTTVATDISATTHDLKLVQRMLGHSNPQMTLKHYDKGRSTEIAGVEAIEKCYGF